MFRLIVSTLEKKVFDGEISSLTLPGAAGELGVLTGHAPLISSLGAGEISARHKDNEFLMFVSGGMAEIQGDKVIVLADEAERAEEVDEQKAEAARQRAEKIMAEKRHSAEEFAYAAAEIEKAAWRLKVARKHRSKKNPTMPYEHF